MKRRDALKCMAWAGTGVLWSMRGGVLRAERLGAGAVPSHGASGLQFVQISDTHIGFSKDANHDVLATLKETVGRIRSIGPAFVVHTGDLTHLSKTEEFDLLEQALADARVPVHYVPGEHDLLDADGRAFLARFGRQSKGAGWYSLDSHGVHLVGLVNVADLKPGGLGRLGDDQLAWLERDLAPLPASTPVVVFAHIPLWSVYPEWGWGTDDSARALALMRRFGSATVLNGHIHQVMHKVEGNVTFHTAMSTAFPQPAPGTAAGPGPMTVPPDLLRTLLGLSTLTYRDARQPIAIADRPLDSAHAPDEATDVAVDNFTFAPRERTIAAGSTVTWINHDDVPHNIVSRGFRSPVLDTGDRYSHRFDEAGTYEYYCGLHPKMTGSVTVAT